MRRHSSCNLIHRATAFKVDLFSRRPRPFSLEEMKRRQRVEVGGVTLPVASAEDCVLTKLEWFEKGGRVIFVSRLSSVAPHFICPATSAAIAFAAAICAAGSPPDFSVTPTAAVNLPSFWRTGTV